MLGTASIRWSVIGLAADDTALASSLHARCFAGGKERLWTAGDFAGLLATPGTFGLTLSRAHEACGLSLLRHAMQEAELLTFGVIPECRRQGGARFLLQASMQSASERGVRKIFLDVAEDNVAAHSLYASSGFRPVGRRAGYYPMADGAVAAIVMKLCL